MIPAAITCTRVVISYHGLVSVLLSSYRTENMSVYTVSAENKNYGSNDRKKLTQGTEGSIAESREIFGHRRGEGTGKLCLAAVQLAYQLSGSPEFQPHVNLPKETFTELPLQLLNLDRTLSAAFDRRKQHKPSQKDQAPPCSVFQPLEVYST